MWGWLPGCLFVWIVEWVWAGWGVCPCGRLGGRLCLVGLFSRVVGLSGAWCRKHARCCLLGGGGCPCVCGGGMLSGFWGSAPWLPDLSGAPGCWGLWVGVGGLVVNCIVDASILL